MPISARYRTSLLWMTWLPQWAALLAVSVISSALFLTMASLVGPEEVRHIAYLCAVAAGFSAFFFLMFDIPHIRLCLSVLREARGA